MTDASSVATRTVARWLQLDPGDPACNNARDAVDAIGRDAQSEAARLVSSLWAPLGDIASHTDDEGDVAKALADLHREIAALDPSELDVRPGLLARALAVVPGVGSPAVRYFQRFESAQRRIASIVTSLEAGRGVLSRDNITLRADQERLHAVSITLEDAIAEAQAFDDALVFAIDVELPFGDLRRPFFEDELLVSVRQRMNDLQRALVLDGQALAAIEVVMSNNRELIRGVDRTRELTLGALSVAASAAAQMTGNKVAIDRLVDVDSTTSDLLASTEARLRTGTSDLRRLPTDRTIELDALRAAFDDLDATLNEVALNRREALPVLERTVRGITP